jgi:hypothetical protein
LQETHQSPQVVPQGGVPENGSLHAKDPVSRDCSRKEPTATLITRLFQLQGQLYRLLLSGDGNVGIKYIQEGLEASKTFLDILQAGSAPKSGLFTAPVVSTGGQQANPSEPTPPESTYSSNSMSENDPSREGRPNAAPMSYIVVQQALTCYLYVLLLLDRVVSVLTGHAGREDVSVSVSQESSTAIHLGFFSLASQPALNNEIVLLLILRLVQHMQEVIQILASNCNELVDDSTQTSTCAGADSGSSGRTREMPVSLAVVLHSMSNLVINREKLLVGRLLSLTGASWN